MQPRLAWNLRISHLSLGEYRGHRPLPQHCAIIFLIPHHIFAVLCVKLSLTPSSVSVSLPTHDLTGGFQAGVLPVGNIAAYPLPNSQMGN